MGHLNGVNGDTATPVPAPVQQELLPSASSHDIVLDVTTSSEYTQCSRLNGEEWKGPLSIGQYLKREQHLMSQDLTKDGKETGWILTSSSLPKDPNGNRPILASCETIPVQGYVARDGQLDRVLVHGIGSVFTRREHRGRGYAARMMTELGKKLETWQQPNGDRGLFSVLYSDIGQKFYNKFGWKPFPSNHIQLVPMGPDFYGRSSQGLPLVDDLTAGDLQGIPATQYAQEELIAASNGKPDVSFVTIAPDVEHFSWHHAREEFVMRALGKQNPEVKGAIHRQTGIALIWSRTFAADQKDWTFHILHAAIPPAAKNSIDGLNALSALLLRAQLEAYKSEMTVVEVWDPSELVIAAAQNLRIEAGDKIKVIHRDEDHICSLRWIGAERAQNEVMWELKQKYSWC